jgi:hypothetical protein
MRRDDRRLRARRTRRRRGAAGQVHPGLPAVRQAHAARQPLVQACSSATTWRSRPTRSRTSHRERDRDEGRHGASGRRDRVRDRVPGLASMLWPLEIDRAPAATRCAPGLGRGRPARVPGRERAALPEPVRAVRARTPTSRTAARSSSTASARCATSCRRCACMLEQGVAHDRGPRRTCTTSTTVRVEAKARDMVWTHPGVTSWYKNDAQPADGDVAVAAAGLLGDDAGVRCGGVQAGAPPGCPGRADHSHRNLIGTAYRPSPKPTPSSPSYSTTPTVNASPAA